MGSFEELDTGEPLEQRMQRHAYDRLIMLTDGVFAIAATLLALEVKIPPGWTGSLETLITTATISKVISYGVSFLVVAIYWMGNRRVLSMFRRVDGLSTFLALTVLMLIALLPPISSTLVTEQGRVTDSSFVYVGYVTLIGLAQALLWSYGAFVANLVDAACSVGFKVRALIWMVAAPTSVSGMAILSMGVLPQPWGYVCVVMVMIAMFAVRHRVMAVDAGG